MAAPQRPLQPIQARRPPSARLPRPVVRDRGFREVRTAQRLRGQAASRTWEERFLLELDRLRIGFETFASSGASPSAASLRGDTAWSLDRFPWRADVRWPGVLGWITERRRLALFRLSRILETRTACREVDPGHRRFVDQRTAANPATAMPEGRRMLSIRRASSGRAAMR